MAKVKGAPKLQEQFAVRMKGCKTVKAAVSYSQSYAIYVHEDLQAKHPNGGKAKFLTDPFNELSEWARDEIVKTYKKLGLDKAVAKVCLRIMRESQQQVPVDTGALKASAFVKVQ